MNLSGIFARAVALIGAAAILWRRLQGVAHEPAWGSAPVVPAAKPQGSIPTLKMPTARGWIDGQTPVAAPGLKVNAFAAMPIWCRTRVGALMPGARLSTRCNELS